MDRLDSAFRNCEKLQNHVRLLLDKGGLYKTYNGNLLFHGSIPLNEDGSLKEVQIYGKTYKGKFHSSLRDRLNNREPSPAIRGCPDSSTHQFNCNSG